MVNINNKQKKYVRRGFSGLGIFLFFFSLLTFAGLELPFYNHFNPLYNPYPYILMGFLFFVARTFIKDTKGVGNFLNFFMRNGLIAKVYEVPFENISPTHINYLSSDGEKHSIRKTAPLTFPSEDIWSNEYLIPSTGLEALNPEMLVKKYGAQLKDIEIPFQKQIESKDDNGNPIQTYVEDSLTITKQMVQQVLGSLSAFIPEISALDPSVIHEQESFSEDVDQLNQEAGYQISEIRKGWFVGSKTQQVVMYVLVGAVVGFMAATLTYMAGHIDFAHLQGMIRGAFN